MKTGTSLHKMALASLHDYLIGLQESGVDGLPHEETGGTLHAGIAAPESLPEKASPADVLPPGGKAVAASPESLERIRKSLGDCQRCKLGATRTNLVFGVGNPHARLVFVGEGPGADEDRQGEPFVGEAGQVLNRIIGAMGLQRSDVYICNVVKCRPPRNRDPEEDEIAACGPFLLRQLQSIRPEVVVALGKFAAQTLLQTKEPISRLRGRFRDYHGTPLMPTYHPSYLLRKQGEGDKGAFWDVWDDMVQVLQVLKLPVPEKSRKK